MHLALWSLRANRFHKSSSKIAGDLQIFLKGTGTIGTMQIYLRVNY